MLDLDALIKGTTAHPDLIEVQYCLEDSKLQEIPKHYEQAGSQTPNTPLGNHDGRRPNYCPKNLRYVALNALHLEHP